MLRGLTIFTGLLGVVLLGTLVVLQVQRGLDDDAAAPTEVEGGEAFIDDELDLGESEPLVPEPLVPEQPISALQSEPDLSIPAANTSLDAPAAGDAIGPPPVESPPRSIDPAPGAFPASRGATTSAPPVTSSPIRPEPGPLDANSAVLPEPPTAFPAPPTLDPPATLSPPPVAGNAPDVTGQAPPADSPVKAARTIRPAAADATVPPTDGLAPPARDSRVIDLPQPPALSDAPLDAPPAASGRDLATPPSAIQPDTARPATPAESAADPLLGIGVVDPRDPRGLQTPQLEITKTIPPTGTIGEPLVYSITIRNNGTATADGVILEDLIPQGAKLTGTVPQAELDKGRLIWSLGEMKPGSEHKIMVRVIPTRAGDLGSTATVRFAARAAASTRIAGPVTAPTATAAPGTQPITTAPATNRPITASPVVTQPSEVTPADATLADVAARNSALSLVVTAPAEAEVGAVLTLKFTLTNHTRSPQSGVVLRNKIPVELGHPAGTDLEYPLPTLAAGASKVITLELTAKSQGQAVNRATLSSGQTLLASDQDTIRISVPQPLKIEQAMPPQASIGISTPLKTVVTNTSDTPSKATTLAQTLAPGLDFLSASGQAKYDPVNGRITWQLPPLQPGATATFTTTVRPRQVGKKLTSLVRLTSGAETLATSSKTMQAMTFAAPSMNIEGVDELASTGSDFEITYRLSNRGTAAVTRGQLRINLPKSLTLSKVTGGSQAAGDKTANLVIIPKLTTINSGDTCSIVITIRAASAGQHRLISQFVCNELQQPLARTDTITTLPGPATP